MTGSPSTSPAPGGEGAKTDFDTTLLRIYADLKDLLAQRDLDPGVRASLVQALANISLAVQDLGLAYEMLYDLGV
jgi:hypothetical protein